MRNNTRNSKNNWNKNNKNNKSREEKSFGKSKRENIGAKSEFESNKKPFEKAYKTKDTYKRKETFQKKEVYNKEMINDVEEKSYEDQVEGRNSVFELLESGKDINKIFVTKGEKHGSINKIIAIAREKRIIIVEKDKKQLDMIAQNENYQGVIAIVPPFEYSEVEEILEDAKTKNEDPFVIILDGIEDPHNLGSIIRTAETAGVHGIIIPKRRAASVNSTVNKVSAGAAQYMKIARVTNISETIEKLKANGLWVCGTDIDTNKYHYNQDLTGPLAIVIGNEGSGMSDKVKKNCDFLVKIPMKGKITSLNAAVSTGIIVYEAVKQKIK